MNDFTWILAFTLPPIIVATVVVLLMYAFFKDARIRRSDELKAENHKLTLNLRLQAYERIALLLERITIKQLVMRLSMPGMAGLQLQWEMLKTINEEFEHNFSQQIYLSTELWDLVKLARESVIRQINSAAARLHEESTGENLTRLLLESELDKKTDHLNDALLFLKKEVRQLF